MANSNHTIKIIAVGNDLYGDDGIGCLILEQLSEVPNLGNVELINAATDALSLIDHIKGTDHVIIIDAAQMGEKPGTVNIFDREDAKLMIKTDHLSVHGISLAETFALAEAIDSLPEKLTIVGIEPQNLGISQKLSKVVTQSMPEIVSRIISIVHKNKFITGGTYA